MPPPLLNVPEPEQNKAQLGSVMCNVQHNTRCDPPASSLIVAPVGIGGQKSCIAARSWPPPVPDAAVINEQGGGVPPLHRAGRWWFGADSEGEETRLGLPYITVGMG